MALSFVSARRYLGILERLHSQHHRIRTYGRLSGEFQSMKYQSCESLKSTNLSRISRSGTNSIYDFHLAICPRSTILGISDSCAKITRNGWIHALQADLGHICRYFFFFLSFCGFSVGETVFLSFFFLVF